MGEKVGVPGPEVGGTGLLSLREEEPGPVPKIWGASGLAQQWVPVRKAELGLGGGAPTSILSMCKSGLWGNPSRCRSSFAEAAAPGPGTPEGRPAREGPGGVPGPRCNLPGRGARARVGVQGLEGQWGVLARSRSEIPGRRAWGEAGGGLGGCRDPGPSRRPAPPFPVPQNPLRAGMSRLPESASQSKRLFSP